MFMSVFGTVYEQWLGLFKCIAHEMVFNEANGEEGKMGMCE
jgi:hypothetical protein